MQTVKGKIPERVYHAPFRRNFDGISLDKNFYTPSSRAAPSTLLLISFSFQRAFTQTTSLRPYSAFSFVSVVDSAFPFAYHSQPHLHPPLPGGLQPDDVRFIATGLLVTRFTILHARTLRGGCCFILTISPAIVVKVRNCRKIPPHPKHLIRAPRSRPPRCGGDHGLPVNKSACARTTINKIRTLNFIWSV